MLQAFGPSLYSADGPTVPFYGFPYPTRMAVAKLSDGGLWAWSPIALNDELLGAVEARLAALPAEGRAGLRFYGQTGDSPAVWMASTIRL